MAEQLEEPTNSTEGGMDRRSLLTKAAAAGAVAWSVPLLLSEPAFAGNGVCTPKCAPASFTPTLKGVDVCDNDFASITGFAGSALQTFIGNSNKMAIISVQGPGSVTCPCGGAASPAVISGLTTSSIFDKVSSQVTTQSALATACASTNTSFEIKVFPLVGYGIAPVVPGGQGFLSSNSYALAKSGGGAIGNSTNRLRAPVCVAVGCPDRNGDIVYRRCQYNLCFSYTPSGSCSTLATVYSLFTLVANSCKVGCGTAC